MRRPTIVVAVLALAAGGAFAQEVPSLGSRLPFTMAQSVPQAPIGHRQPTVKDLPPDVARDERPADASRGEQQSAPLPEKFTTSVWLPGALVTIVSVPVRVPVVVGVKLTLYWHVFPAATGPVQVLVCVKSPVSVADVTLPGPLPRFETLTKN